MINEYKWINNSQKKREKGGGRRKVMMSDEFEMAHDHKVALLKHLILQYKKKVAKLKSPSHRKYFVSKKVECVCVYVFVWRM